MSKIGKIPIELKEGAALEKELGGVKVTGPKGSLSFKLPEGILVDLKDNKIVVSLKKADEKGKMLFGLTRSLIANMVKGVTDGFEKKLELSGVGFRAQVSGNDLILSVGFATSVKITAPEGIKFQVLENTIKVFGIDKTLVGDVASKIRKVRPPDPYKGKGISYFGERIRRKAGKAAKTVGGK